MKYRLTRDDGARLDVPGSLWESVLHHAYRNGWRPSGTGAPWAPRHGADASEDPGPPPHVLGRTDERWPEADYFSPSSQYVREADALELGAAILRSAPVSGGPEDLARSRADAAMRRVAAFARIGGFVIGEAP